MPLRARQLLEISPKTLIAWAAECASAALAANQTMFGTDRRIHQSLDVATSWQSASTEALIRSQRIAADAADQVRAGGEFDRQTALKAALSVEFVARAAITARTDIDELRVGYVCAAGDAAREAGVADVTARLLAMTDVPAQLWPIAVTLIDDGATVPAALDAARRLT